MTLKQKGMLLLLCYEDDNIPDTAQLHNVLSACAVDAPAVTAEARGGAVSLWGGTIVKGWVEKITVFTYYLYSMR